MVIGVFIWFSWMFEKHQPNYWFCGFEWIANSLESNLDLTRMTGSWFGGVPPSRFQTFLSWWPKLMAGLRHNCPTIIKPPKRTQLFWHKDFEKSRGLSPLGIWDGFRYDLDGSISYLNIVRLDECIDPGPHTRPREGIMIVSCMNFFFHALYYKLLSLCCILTNNFWTLHHQTNHGQSRTKL